MESHTNPHTGSFSHFILLFCYNCLLPGYQLDYLKAVFVFPCTWKYSEDFCNLGSNWCPMCLRSCLRQLLRPPQGVFQLWLVLRRAAWKQKPHDVSDSSPPHAILSSSYKQTNKQIQLSKYFKLTALFFFPSNFSRMVLHCTGKKNLKEILFVTSLCLLLLWANKAVWEHWSRFSGA